MGLGCMGMSGAYGAADDAESLATINRALDIGINLLDTADVYGAGRNEELVGRAIAGRRREVALATKCGFVWDGRGESVGLDGSPRHVRQACEASLRRLGVEAIDLYYLHRVDPRVPVEETMGAMGYLVAEGKVRYLGLSEVSAATLRRAHSAHPITALQSEYSLWTRDAEREALPACRELGIGFVPFSPLGRGFLTGRIKEARELREGDMRRGLPRFQGENFRSNVGLAARVKEAAARKGCTPAQLALAWVLAQGEDVVPIPGTKRRRYLEENIGALEVALDADDLRRLGGLVPPGAAAGGRYPEEMMRMVDR
ncbi:MAG TPA: aldo/keto reductase [Acetobacteraceae bacterium]|nr:aldo/keto reductase [Acetobacteraceae bacterium]